MWTATMNFVCFWLFVLLPIAVSGYHEVTADATVEWTTDDGPTTEETTTSLSLIGRVNMFTLGFTEQKHVCLISLF